MISTTILATEVDKGTKVGRKSVVVLKHTRPDGRIMLKVHTRGTTGHSVQVHGPDDFVRVWVNVCAEPDCSEPAEREGLCDRDFYGSTMRDRGGYLA